MNLDTTYATIISLVPYDIIETKPGLHPTEYHINKAEGDKIGLTIIPNNAYHRVNPDPLADEKHTRYINVPVPAFELARSIISDYAVSLLAVELPDRMPGLMHVKGNYTDRKEVAMTYTKQLMELRNAQNNWFKALVIIADDMWAKTRSPLSISDIQRTAATALELKRDWLSPVNPEELNKCPICKAVINEGALKCVGCGTVLNKKEYDKAMATLV